jgi:predicted O-methyltransferase YrrM
MVTDVVEDDLIVLGSGRRTTAAVAVFATALFSSAFLIFSVQPFVAKTLLPTLGGTPMVWNTCVVFFQAVVLAGYAIAHSIASRRGTVAAWIYPTLLAAGILVLPMAFTRQPAADVPPGIWLLAELARVAGLPVLALSVTAPLLQACYARTTLPGATDPYFLYAASNAGSFLALFVYPALIEPLLGLRAQSGWWATGYAICAALATGCVWFSIRQGRTVTEAPAAPDTFVTAGMRVRWIVLAFIPSSLMLGVTTYISTDIAAVPLMWVVPLGLYLATFVIAFSRSFPPRTLRRLERDVPLVGLSLTFLLAAHLAFPVYLNIPIHLAAFVFLALVCHGRLAAERPSTIHLTQYYLLVSIGGVAGGVFNTLIAPMVFNNVLEYPLMLVAACATPLLWRSSWPRHEVLLDLGYGVALTAAFALVATIMPAFLSDAVRYLPIVLGVLVVVSFSQSRRPLRFVLMLAGLLIGSALWSTPYGQVLHAERTFFGTYHVSEEQGGRFRALYHGTTLHGRQATESPANRTPLTYYHPSGPFGQAFQALPRLRAAREIGAVGLGVGSLAAYADGDQQWTFFEIDPAIERIARDNGFFTFLDRCGARCRVVLGDARLSLQEAPQQFDAIVLDAFSSDSIPLHLLTREALDLYLSRLNPDGVLLFHISNRYLALGDVLGRLARERGLTAVRQLQQAESEMLREGGISSEWVVVSENPDVIAPLSFNRAWSVLGQSTGAALWTDDYSNILSVLRTNLR